MAENRRGRPETDPDIGSYSGDPRDAPRASHGRRRPDPVDPTILDYLIGGILVAIVVVVVAIYVSAWWIVATPFRLGRELWRTIR